MMTIVNCFLEKFLRVFLVALFYRSVHYASSSIQKVGIFPNQLFLSTHIFRGVTAVEEIEVGQRESGIQQLIMRNDFLHNFGSSSCWSSNFKKIVQVFILATSNTMLTSRQASTAHLNFVLLDQAYNISTRDKLDFLSHWFLSGTH